MGPGGSLFLEASPTPTHSECVLSWHWRGSRASLHLQAMRDAQKECTSSDDLLSDSPRAPWPASQLSPDFQAVLLLLQSAFVGKTFFSKAQRDLGIDSGSPPTPMFLTAPTLSHCAVQTRSLSSCLREIDSPRIKQPSCLPLC